MSQLPWSLSLFLKCRILTSAQTFFHFGLIVAGPKTGPGRRRSDRMSKVQNSKSAESSTPFLASRNESSNLMRPVNFPLRNYVINTS